MMTAFGTVENAVECMREGAYDFITKPLKRAIVVRSVQRALERRELLHENRVLRRAMGATAGDVVGQSLALRHMLDVVAQAAPATPIAGAPSRPKISIQSSSPLSRFASTMITTMARICPMACNVCRKTTNARNGATLGIMMRANIAAAGTSSRGSPIQVRNGCAVRSKAPKGTVSPSASTIPRCSAPATAA